MATSQPTKGVKTPKSFNCYGLKGKTPYEQALLEQLDAASSPKFLVATRTDGEDFKAVKSIIFARHIEGVFGELDQVSKMRNGSLLLKTRTSGQVELLKKCTHFGDIPVKVEEHQSLNQVRGVIFNRDLLLNTDEELEEDMKHRGVTKVRRITRKVNGKDVDTGAFIISFDLPVLPDKVKATTYRLDVQPYIPAPMRCFTCQRFGHMSSRCPNPAVCGNCGREPHGAEECSPPPRCTNCPGAHPPRDRNCPVFLGERKIQEIKTLERISYQEARRKFHSLNSGTRQLDFGAIGRSLATFTSPFQTQPARSQTPASSVSVSVPASVPVPQKPAVVAKSSNPAKRSSPKEGTAPPAAKKKPAQVTTRSPAQPEKKAKASSPKRLAKNATKPAEAASSTKAGKPSPGQSSNLPKAGKTVPPRREDFLKNPPSVSKPTAGTVEESAPAPREASPAKPPRSPRKRSPRQRHASRSPSESHTAPSSSSGEEMEVADSEGSDL